jgi:hypothetical protein
VSQFPTCKRCGEQYRPHSGTILFSSGTVRKWQVDFRWPKDLCECCALAIGFEDFAECALSGELDGDKD